MKKEILLSFGILFCANGFAQKAKIEDCRIGEKDDKVTVSFMVTPDKIKSDERLTITPVLYDSNESDSLPPLIIVGHRRVITDKRNSVLQGIRTKKNQSIPYSVIVPYRNWMSDVSLRMDYLVENCCSEQTLPPQILVANEVLRINVLPYQITPSLAYIRPKAETVKRRAVVKEAFLDFALGKTDIRSDYMNNQHELEKITDMIDQVKNDPNLLVSSISIIGYASPEGKLALNEQLSKKRASALIDYLLPRFDYPHSKYRVEFGGENWTGLRARVEASDMPQKSDILDIIDNVPAEINYKTNTSRKKSLMNLDHGKPFRYMLKEFCPALRTAVCKIDYTVKDFSVEDAKQIILTRPQNLSLNEMFAVASTFENGSQEFIDVFETAVKMYPDDQTANLNAALAALARRDLASAEKYLGRITVKLRMPEYDNALGVLAMLKGDFDRAEEYFKASAQNGLAESKLNLEQIAKKRENMEIISKQKKR